MNTPAAGPRGRALVTGGAGFIGAHLARTLAQAGYMVDVWARPAGGASRRVAPPVGVSVHEIDVRSREAVAAALAARPPDRVFHLAGVRLMGNSPANVARMFETNVLGTLHVLEGVRPEARVVVVGSGEEYGRAPVPFQETEIARAQTAYAVSRLATTLACQALKSPPICVARLAVVYGPGQVGEMLIPSLLAACVRREPFPMTSGEQTRDFIFVEDAVRALAALAEAPIAMGQVVNVATGIERTVREVAELAARLSGEGADLRIGAIASRAGEASRYVCDIGKVEALTGWLPQVSLEEGLERTRDWWRQRAPRA